MAGDLRNRFGRPCQRALAEGAISKSQAGELLDIAIAIVDMDGYVRGLRAPAGAG